MYAFMSGLHVHTCTGSPGTEVTETCEPVHGSWEANLGLLKIHVLLSAKPALQHHNDLTCSQPLFGTAQF